MAELIRGTRSQPGVEVRKPAEAPGRRMRRVVAGAAMVLCLVLIAMYAWKRETRSTMRYTTVAASRGTVAQAVLSSGTVNPVTTIQVGSYVSGVIQSIACDFNTQVKAGQLCAKIDPRPYQTVVEQTAAALRTVRALLEKDRANFAYAKLIDERNQGLLGRGIVSQETADTSHNAYAQARAQLAYDKADVEQHQAQWQAARVNLGYTDIASPVDGTVVSRNVTQGQTVAASFQTPTLFLIATDLTRMQVDSNVSESDIGRVKVGDQASFTVSSFPERQFAGRALQVRQAPQTVQNVVTYDVVVGAPNPDLALKPGMTASVRIVTRRVDGVLRVPDQALRYRPTTAAAEQDGAHGPRAAHARDTAQVWVLVNGQPRRLPVTVGLDDDTYAEITGGALREGDAVIVAGSAVAPQRGPAPAAGMPPLGR
jgi:HlyD family secretion protein